MIVYICGCLTKGDTLGPRVGALLMMVGSMLYLELPYPLSLIGAAILGAGVCLIIRGPDDWWRRRKRQLMATVLKVRTVLAWGVSARRPVPA